MNRVEHLDGLRGLAALWVLVGHCMILTGFSLPIIGMPDLGVDLFIVLSGFLMTFQYNVRKDREDWNSPGTWLSFWIRRVFRVSPLYFSMLIAALSLGQEIYADRMIIDGFIGNPFQSPERYTDTSATNFLIHVTYIFGLLPNYAFRTPLPDWSLGLEMQFYAIFPLAVLLARKTGWLPAAICICAISIGTVFVTKKLGIIFPMPAFLPLKMHLFLVGMLIAAAVGKGKGPYLACAMLLAAIPIGGGRDLLHLAVREVIVVGFFSLVHWRAVPSIDRLAGLLGSPPFRWLGELSYGVYLVHLLILHRVAAWTIIQWGHDISSAERFAIAFGIVAPIAYSIAYATYVLVERPGQKLGRSVLTVVERRKQAT